jgi:hypothetical protein
MGRCSVGAPSRGNRCRGCCGGGGCGLLEAGDRLDPVMGESGRRESHQIRRRSKESGCYGPCPRQHNARWKRPVGVDHWHRCGRSYGPRLGGCHLDIHGLPEDALQRSFCRGVTGPAPVFLLQLGVSSPGPHTVGHHLGAGHRGAHSGRDRHQSTTIGIRARPHIDGTGPGVGGSWGCRWVRSAQGGRWPRKLL